LQETASLPYGRDIKRSSPRFYERYWNVLRQPYVWLLCPVSIVLVVFFVLPLLTMMQYSFYTQVAGGTNAAITTLIALILGYPVAYVIARGHPSISRILLIAVISPLLVGIVIRTYGWMVLLGRQGVVNKMLLATGLIDAPLRLTGNDVGVIISLLHVFYPFMVLPLVGVLYKIDRPLEEAAMLLGANRLQVFYRIILPLSIPGIASGSLLVFLLTASSFVTPRLIGKNLTKWFLTLLEEQVLTVFHWPFGAALAVIFIVVVLLMVAAYLQALESKFAFLLRGKSV
jgi:putative spermidine/putrescine transport system permease protein